MIYKLFVCSFIWCVSRDSSVGIATRYRLDGPGIEFRLGWDFSAPAQTGPGAYPVSCTMGTGSFPGVKRPRRGADHPPSSKCRDQERVGLYLCSSSGPSWPVMGAPLFDARFALILFYVLHVQQDSLDNKSVHPEGSSYIQHASAEYDVCPSVSPGRTGCRQSGLVYRCCCQYRCLRGMCSLLANLFVAASVV